MTICVFYKGVLYADRAAVAQSAPTYYVEMKKLFISPCSRVAFAVSGEKLPEDFATGKAMKTVVNYILDIKESIPIGKELPESIVNILKNRHILILTKDRLYKYCKEYIVEMDKDLITTVGTGGKPLTIALIAGKGIMEALRIASECDPASYMTDVDSVAQSKLL